MEPTRHETGCEITGCVAHAEVGRSTCGPHRDGRTAKELKIAKSPWTGKGGESCIRCRRAFVETDWVGKHRVRVEKKGDFRGYQHLVCEPVRAAKAKGSAGTPLFEALG